MKNILFLLLLFPLKLFCQNYDEVPINPIALFIIKENVKEHIYFTDSCGQSVKLTRGDTSVIDSIGAVIIFWIFFDRLDFWLTYRKYNKK
jgi:hypothetical protein